MMRRKIHLLLVGMFCAANASAAATFDWAPVGDPGNAADNTGFGSVSTSYFVSRYEVTNAQYAQFLGAKAVSDPLGLYNANMGSHPLGGIVRSGVSGSFSYSVKSGYADMPVVFVSW